MTTFRVVTINLLSELSRWEQRKGLLVSGLNDLQPDLIATQEVNLQNGTASWLADMLGMEYVFLTPKTGREGLAEGLALLSRQPFDHTRWIDLGSQHRVAQQAQLRFAGRLLSVTNVHLFWQPGNSSERLAQAQKLLDWLEALPADQPSVLCGDFNSYPDSPSIRLVKEHYTSAYEAAHGSEPELTSPTPLPRSKLALAKTLAEFWKYLRPSMLFVPWKGTIDYIFTNRHVRVVSSQVVLDRPSAEDPRLFPSDHFGIAAELEI